MYGYYCPLHTFQKPKQNADGSLAFESPVVEQFLRRSTSFVGPELTVALALASALRAGQVKGASAPLTSARSKDSSAPAGSANGAAILGWLIEARAMDEQGGRAFVQRMLQQAYLQPVTANVPSDRFIADAKTIYKVTAAVNDSSNNMQRR
jgi:hypothetical protein